MLIGKSDASAFKKNHNPGGKLGKLSLHPVGGVQAPLDLAFIQFFLPKLYEHSFQVVPL